MTKREQFIIETLRESNPVFRHFRSEKQLLQSSEGKVMAKSLQWQAEQSAMAGRRSDGYEIEKAFEEAMMNAGTEDV